MLYALLFALVTVSLASEPGEKEGYYRDGGYRGGYNAMDNYGNRGYYRDERYYNNYNNRGYYRENSNYKKEDPCAASKPVEKFNNYFADEVKNCEQLTSIFNGGKNVTREEMKAAVYYIVSVLAEQGGYEKPTQQALNAIKNIVPNCENICPDLLRSIYSNTAGKRLEQDKKLCCNNAQVLAKTYAQVTKDVAEIVAGKNCPRSQILSVITGLSNFLERQDLYNGDNIADVAVAYSNEWRCQDKNATAKKCKIACYSPAKPGLKECDNVCKIKDKAIDLFVSAFDKQVKGCKTLQNVFNIEKTVSPAMFSRGTYYIDLLFNSQYNVSYPREISDFQSRYVKNFKTLKPCVVQNVFAQFLGKYLLSEKILDTKNAEKLAEMYAQLVKDKAGVFLDDNFSRSKVVVIQTSWRRFLYSLDAVSPEKKAKITYFLGNEWRCQSKA